MTKVPNGSEKGSFLAVDLGGTNCRICLIDLHGDATYTLLQSKHVVPRALVVNKSYRPLFKFIAEKIADFLEQNARSIIRDEKETTGGLKLGFTFSFTYEQHSLASGTLLAWDKGWNISEALGRDPCLLLQEAIDELELPVVVTALVNDSVGTLVARSYTSRGDFSTLAGAILGTGTNAAYVERLANVKKLHSRPEFQTHGHNDLMLINTEWGSFDDGMEVLPSTAYDETLDKDSERPSTQMLEKRMSGLYLGELLRLVILEMRAAGLFDMTVAEDSPLADQYGIDSSILSNVAKDSSESLLEASGQITKALKANSVSHEDARAIRLLSVAIARRAGLLAGAALAALVIQSGRLQRTSASPTSGELTVQTPQLNKGIGCLDSTPQKLTLRPRLQGLIRQLLKTYGLTGLLSPPRVRSAGVPVCDDHPPKDPAGVIDVGVDGALIEFYPDFQKDMREALRTIPEIGPDGESKVRIGLVKNGSSLGAALIAESALS